MIVTVPPLRERRDDVPLLVQHFIAPFVRAGKSLRFSPEAMARLQQYDWPGNIRELRNLIERLLILHEGEEIGMAMLPREFLKSATPAAAEAEPEGTSDTLPSLAEIERRVQTIEDGTAKLIPAEEAFRSLDIGLDEEPPSSDATPEKRD